jgi:hypothetical protein
MPEQKSDSSNDAITLKTFEGIDHLLRHIENVSSNCTILGKKLIERGNIEFGNALIANGLIHDNSKFFGIEYDHLNSDDLEKQKLAIYQHNRTNRHHPEFWGNIKDMPKIFVAEMVCDWKARSNEFGTDLRAWIENSAMSKYSFTKKDKIWKWIKEFLDLLLDKPFKQIK